MFKAKLIENKSYYPLRGRQLTLLLLMSVPLGLLANFYRFPMPWILAGTGLYILFIVLMLRNQKLMNLVTGNKSLEIDEAEIRISSKKDRSEEIIPMSTVEKIVLKKEYGIPQENLKDIVKEMKGNARKNYIILHQKDRQRRIDFEIDSYYMIGQLDKITASWKNNGYRIERI